MKCAPFNTPADDTPIDRSSRDASGGNRHRSQKNSPSLDICAKMRLTFEYGNRTESNLTVRHTIGHRASARLNPVGHRTSPRRIPQGDKHPDLAYYRRRVHRRGPVASRYQVPLGRTNPSFRSLKNPSNPSSIPPARICQMSHHSRLRHPVNMTGSESHEQHV